jgi:peptide/nickel transport system substrate-binding protein
MQLRPDVTLHDGRRLTADLVVQIVRREWNRAKPRGFTYLQSLDAPNESSVLFRLSRPDTFLIDAIASTGITDGDVGTGPFRLVSRTPAIEAERNQVYYRGSPGVSGVRIVPYETQRAAWAAMMRGDVDGVQEVARESVDFLEGASTIKKYSSIRPFYISLVFNLRHPILKQVEVRRALAEAIDRAEIVRLGMRGHGIVADDPIWPYHWAYSAAARRYSHNPNAARLRLDAAGLPVRKASDPAAMASRFQLECVFWDEGPQFERIALLLQRQLAAAGIDLTLQPAPLQGMGKRAREGQFDTLLVPMTSGRTFEKNYQFWHSPSAGTNQFLDIGYTGVDDVLDQLRVARSEREIRAGVADLRERFYEDAPAVFLAWPDTTRAIDARFDVGGRPDPDIFENLWQWRPVLEQRASR